MNIERKNVMYIYDISSIIIINIKKYIYIIIYFVYIFILSFILLLVMETVSFDMSLTTYS